MNFLQTILATLISSTTVAGIITFILKASFSSILNKKAKVFENKLEEKLLNLKHEFQLNEQVNETIFKSYIQHKEKQLSDFYGPIYAHLKRGRPIYDLWIKGRLDQISDSIRDLFIESNNSVVEIITTKSHLIEGSEIPSSFTHYMGHVAIWHSYLNTKHRGVPSNEKNFPFAYYPDDFEKEIFETTELLKRQLDNLHTQYAERLVIKNNQLV